MKAGTRGSVFFKPQQLQSAHGVRIIMSTGKESAMRRSDRILNGDRSILLTNHIPQRFLASDTAWHYPFNPFLARS